MQAVIGHGQLDRMAFRHDQGQSGHGREMHGDDTSAHDQAGNVFEQLMEGAIAIAKIARQ
ncbi:hypothetical protein D3C76_1190140 [compost metagenome]